MQSCQFAKTVIERGSGKFSAAPPAAVSSAELQYSRSRPCSPPPRDVDDGFQSCASTSVAVLELANSVAPRARPSNSTSTPRRRDGFLASFCSVHSFCASCELFWSYVLPATAGVSCCLHYSVSVGRHSVFRPCLFVVGVRIYDYFPGKVCFMFIHFRVIFSPTLPVRRGAYSLANLL